MQLRKLLMGAALALVAPMAIMTVGCGEEPTPAETDAGQVAADAGTNGDTDAGTNGGTDAGTETDAGTVPTTSVIWFYGDYKEDNKYSVGRHDVVEGTTTDLAFDDLGTSRATQYDVAPDGSKVAIHGAKTVAGRLDLLLMNGDGTELKTLVAMPSTDGAQDVIDLAFSPDGSKVLFRADYAADGVNDVFVVPTSGGTPVKVSPDRPGDAADPKALAAVTMSWSPSGKYVAIVGDLNVDRTNELFIADVSGATPSIVTALPASEIGDVSAETGSFGAANHLAWSNDDRLIFKLKKVGQTKYTLYSVKTDGTDLQRVAHSPDETVDIGAIASSPDGKLLAYSADAITAGAFETYVLPLDGSAAPTLISSGSVGAGRSVFFTGMRWSPDSSKIAFLADYDAGAVGHFDLYVSSAQGPAVRLVAVGDTDDKDVDVEDGFSWAPDSSGIVFAADHLEKNRVDVFRTTDLTTPDQTPITVQAYVDGGDSLSDVYWTP